MVEQQDTTNTPRWSTPRLVALGTAQASRAGTSAYNREDDTYFPNSPG